MTVFISCSICLTTGFLLWILVDCRQAAVCCCPCAASGNSAIFENVAGGFRVEKRKKAVRLPYLAIGTLCRHLCALVIWMIFSGAAYEYR